MFKQKMSESTFAPGTPHTQFVDPATFRIFHVHTAANTHADNFISIMSYKPNIAIHPGQVIAEMLRREGMTQKNLCERMGMSEKHLSQIINGEASITVETSLLLENAMGGTASFWNNLEQNYQENKARIERTELLEDEIALLPRFPYNELVNRGYVSHSPDKGKRIENLWRFFGVNSLSYVSATEAVAFRKGDTGDDRSEAIASWLRCGEIEARKLTLPKYSAPMLRRCLGKLKLLSRRSPSDELEEAARLLGECGVALLFIPHFPGTRVSGAVRWIHRTPVIQLSAYYPWADVFWFNLYHEIGHLLLHGKKEEFVEFAESERTGLRTQEAEADEFAREALIPQKAYAQFLEVESGLRREKIIAFARSLGIHEGIVAGRLCHDKRIGWGQVSRLRRRLMCV